MKRNHNLRKIKTKKSYSTTELAETLGVHIQTIRSWHKNGLKSIDSSSHYALFIVSDIKQYLQKQMEKRRIKLEAHEFYCFGCRQKTTSKKITIKPQNRLIGIDKESVILKGICIKCGKTVNKFSIKPQNNADRQKKTNSGFQMPLY